MDKYLVALLILLNAHTVGEAQLKRSTFALSGRINSDKDGVLILMPVNDTSYYSDFNSTYSSEVKQGRFQFSGLIRYPTAFRAGFKVDSNWLYISDIFFIDSGIQSIFCNIDSSRTLPAIANSSMSELLGRYSQEFASIRNEWGGYYEIRSALRQKFDKALPERLKDSLDAVRNILEYRQDSLLWSYVRKHPYSFVAMWEAVAEFSSGYKRIFDTIYPCFSPDMRKTSTGLAFGTRLESARHSCVGCVFPKISLVSLSHTNRKLLVSRVYSKYTLVDFWFSHCAPCMEQFQEYSKIYETYNTKGFQLVGISTDNPSQIDDWKAAIRDHGLKWPQFLDVGGSFARQLSILTWPSNFLLDEKGTIVLRNVDLHQLEKFLKANL